MRQTLFKKLTTSYYYDGNCSDFNVSSEIKTEAAAHYSGFVEGSYFKVCFYNPLTWINKLILLIAFVYIYHCFIVALFESDTAIISNQYDTKISPANWTFAIWAVIYTWQIIHVVYSLTLLCRKGSHGNYLYVHPEPLHYSFYIVYYIINNLLNLGWIFVFDRSGKRPELFIVAMFLLWLITFTLYICCVLICKYLSRTGAALELSGNVKDIWMIRIFALNDITFYGTKVP